MSIPKSIWQTWKKPYADLPVVKGNDLKELTQGWRKSNPGYAYFYCDDNACLNMIKGKDAELYDCMLECERINIGSMKSDIFRYFVLYERGGFYADIDTICCEPIDNWIKPGCRFILSPEDNSVCFEQWFLGAEKGHPLLKALLEAIKKKFKSGIDYTFPHFVHTSTGPGIFTSAIMDFLKIDNQGKLADLSDDYNKLAAVKGLGIHIYKDYRYFRDGKPDGVVRHLYASGNWFDGSYDNWKTQRAAVSDKVGRK